MEKTSAALTKRAQDSLALEAEEAQKAGALGFMARALVQATMPHSKSETPYFERTNGALTLTIMAPPRVGLPYGSVPRLLMAWITTEATRTKGRELILGPSLSAFMRELGMVPAGVNYTPSESGSPAILQHNLAYLPGQAEIGWAELCHCR